MILRSLQTVARAACVLALGAAALPAAELLRTDGQTLAAELVAADADGIEVEVGSTPQRLGYDEVVRWGEPVDPQPRPRIVLRDGSQLVAGPPWTKQGSVQLADGVFQFQSAMMLKPLELPRRSVDLLLFEAARGSEASLDFSDGNARDLDQLYLINGDVLTGELQALGYGKATLRVAGEPIEIELTKIAAVRLQQPDTPVETAVGQLAIGLNDGSLLRASECIGKRITLTGGPVFNCRRSSDIVFLQKLAGGVTYLSDLSPIDYRHTPYAGVAWGYALDENLAGQPLRATGRRHLKGVAMHSPSRLVYRLTPGEHDQFDFAMAIDDAAVGNPSTAGEGRGGSVVYRVLVAKSGRFEVAFTSPVVRSDAPPQPASVDITDARAIALVIEPADFGDRLDHADWLDARLVRGKTQ